MDGAKRKIVMRAAWHTMIANMLLSAFKLFAGVFAHSAAMVSDAVHSFSDTATTVVVMAGVKMAGKQADKEHPYGHERMECVAAVIIAAALVAVGVMIGWEGAARMMDPEEIPTPGVLALAAAVASVAVKEAMYWYTRAVAKKAGSGALMADAWHHRSDSLSSVGSFAGILGARLGWPILDPAVCVIICLFILRAAVMIFLDAVGKMTDKSCDAKTIDEIRAVVLERQAVMGIDRLHTRIFGERIYIDLEISIDGAVSLREAHSVAEEIHDAIEARFANVKHCMVHVNPALWGVSPDR